MLRDVLLAGVVAVLLVGCKAAPGKKTAFVGDTSSMETVPEIEAFHKVWVKPDVDWEKYKKIRIAPVNTAYLRERTGWQKTSFAKHHKAVEELAEYTRKTFIEAHRKNTHKYALEVVDEADAQTVVMELAITQLVPTKAWLNAVALAGIMTAVDKGVIALEGRVCDGVTGEVVCTFADREMGKMNILNVKDLTCYSHAKASIKDWAKQTVQVVNSEEGDVVKDSSSFELKLW